MTKINIILSALSFLVVVLLQNSYGYGMKIIINNNGLITPEKIAGYPVYNSQAVFSLDLFPWVVDIPSQGTITEEIPVDFAKQIKSGAIDISVAITHTNKDESGNLDVIGSSISQCSVNAALTPDSAIVVDVFSDSCNVSIQNGSK